MMEYIFNFQAHFRQINWYCNANTIGEYGKYSEEKRFHSKFQIFCAHISGSWQKKSSQVLGNFSNEGGCISSEIAHHTISGGKSETQAEILKNL